MKKLLVCLICLMLLCMTVMAEEGLRLAGHYFKHWMKLTDNVDVFVSDECWK